MHRGLTQYDLAEAVGTNKAVISLLENGKRPLSDKWLRLFAEVLVTSRGDILDRCPDGENVGTKPPHYLREWRTFRKLTQQEVAIRIGTTASQVSMLELGERRLSLPWLQKLAPVLGASPGDLIERHPSGDEAGGLLSAWEDKPPHYLRVWRKHRGLTLAAVEQEVHLSHAQLSRIETGKQPYNQGLLEKLADVYGCEVVDLLVRNPVETNATEPVDETDPNGGPNHLRAWREYRGMSQPELAELAGTSHQVIGYLERGRTQLSAKWLRKLAPILGTTPGHILDYEPRDQSHDVMSLWSKIDDADRDQAARVLQSFVRL